MPNKRNIRKIMGIGVVCLFLLGCSKDSLLLAEEETTIVQEGVLQEGAISESRTIDDSSNVSEAEQVSEDENSKETMIEDSSKTLLGIHICGAVYKPGVYFLEQGARICHAIEMAGGLTEEAAGDYINQACILEDGMKITIPTKEEKTQSPYVEYQESQTMEKHSTEAKVNLNTADEALLCTLPGIGESRANSIISYRTKNGPFEKIEDVMKVSGIKEAAFEKIKDRISVK